MRRNRTRSTPRLNGPVDVGHEDGNVVLLVAFMIVVICGFGAVVADVGSLYVQKQTAQAGADAGALAGADDLLKGASAAANSAYQTATANDPSTSYTTSADTTSGTVQVGGQQSVPLWFARVWGLNETSLHVFAKAQLGTLVSAVGVVPIAITNQTFTYGQEVYLTSDAGSGLSGNYGLLDFSGQGSHGLEPDIENGFDFPLSVGEQVSTLPGRHVSAVTTGISARMSQASSMQSCNSIDNVASDCPRLLYLPIVDTLDVSGKKDITILGFAAFYLDGLTADNGQGHVQVYGRFIRIIRPGQIGNGVNYGTYSIRLAR